MKWKTLFDKKILERGRDYFENGAVEELELNEDTITAIVSGNDDYDVDITVENGNIADIECTCPYSADGYRCKHMAAVLYAYEAMSESQKNSKKSTLSPEELIDRADEETVRIFLLKALKNDKDLLLKFRIEMNRGSGKVDLEPYKQRIRAIIRKYSDKYGFIDYHGAYGFIRDVLNILHNDIEYLSQSNLSEALELSCYLFVEVSDVEMDDSDGGLAEFGDYVVEAWEKMLRKADKKLQMQMFQWFKQHLDGSVIDYMEDFIESALFDNFNEQEFLLQKLEFVDEMISLPDKSAYESEYRKEHWILRRIKVMMQMEMSSDEIIKFCNKHYALRSVRKFLADMYENMGDYEQEIAVLEESLRLDAEYRGIVHNCHEKLMEIYRRLGNNEQYHKQLWTLIVEFFSIEYYRELKSLHTDDWESVFEQLIKDVKQSDLPEIYVEEKLYDDLLRYADEHGNVFILEHYESIFAEHYPEYILGKYTVILEESAINTSTRSTYSQWAARLNKMAKWRGGKECVKAILDKWRTVYKNRPAMLEELKKVKI